MNIFEPYNSSIESPLPEIRRIAFRTFSTAMYDQKISRSEKKQAEQTTATLLYEYIANHQIITGKKSEYAGYIYCYLVARPQSLFDVLIGRLKGRVAFPTPTKALLLGIANAEDMGWNHQEIDEEINDHFTFLVNDVLTNAMKQIEPDRLETIKKQYEEKQRQYEEEALREAEWQYEDMRYEFES